MAEDVLNFIHSLNAPNVSLVGHSMGGKISMTAALMEVIFEIVMIFFLADNGG